MRPALTARQPLKAKKSNSLARIDNLLLENTTTTKKNTIGIRRDLIDEEYKENVMPVAMVKSMSVNMLKETPRLPPQDLKREEELSEEHNGDDFFSRFFDHENSLLSESSADSNESFSFRDRKVRNNENYHDAYYQQQLYPAWDHHESDMSIDLNSGDDEEELDYELIESIMDNEEHKIQITSNKIVDWSKVNNLNRIESAQFAHLIYIVETFNKILVNIYKVQLFPHDKGFAPISINEFVCSMLNDESSQKGLFQRVVFYLVRIVFFLNHRQLIDQFTWFGLRMDSVFEIDPRRHTISESRAVSLEILALLCFKLYNKSTFTSKDHSSYLASDYLNAVDAKIPTLVEELSTVESVNQMSIASKLLLCNSLIEGILENKKHNVSVDCVYKPKINKILDEIEKLNRKVNTGAYSYYRMIETRRTKQLIKFKEKELNKLARIEPFAHLNVADQAFSFHFWIFDSWPRHLVIEKRFHVDKEIKESEWFVISDLTKLEELVQLVENNSNDSWLAISLRDMMDVMKQHHDCIVLPVRRSVFDFVDCDTVLNKQFRFESPPSPICLSLSQFKRQRSRLTRSMSFSCDDSKPAGWSDCPINSVTHTAVLDDFIHLKNQLDASSFIDSKVYFDQKRLSGYEPSPIYQELEANLKADYELLMSGQDFVPKMKSYMKLVHECTSKKYIEIKFCQDPVEKNWLLMLDRAQTVNQLYMLIQVLDRNIKWRMSRAETVCIICKKAVNKISNNKESCSKCDAEFHLECLTSQKNKQKLLQVYKLAYKLCCEECKNSEESAKEAKRLELNLQAEQLNEMNSIEVNKYKLRLNKNRVEKLVDEVVIERPKRAARATRASTKDIKKDEEIYIKRGRGKKSKANDQSDDEDNYVVPRKKVNENEAPVERKYTLRARK